MCERKFQCVIGRKIDRRGSYGSWELSRYPTLFLDIQRLRVERERFVNLVVGAANSRNGKPDTSAEDGATTVVKLGEPSCPDSLFNPSLVSYLMQRRLG